MIQSNQYMGVILIRRGSLQNLWFICLVYRRRRRGLIYLWDETDIASVFLKNQTKVFFGVILRRHGFHVDVKNRVDGCMVPSFKLKFPLA